MILKSARTNLNVLQVIAFAVAEKSLLGIHSAKELVFRKLPSFTSKMFVRLVRVKIRAEL